MNAERIGFSLSFSCCGKEMTVFGSVVEGLSG